MEFKNNYDFVKNEEEILKVYDLISGVKQIFYKLVDHRFVHEAVLEENGIEI